MDCEVCGASGANSFMEVDGLRLLACRNCAGTKSLAQENLSAVFSSPQRKLFSRSSSFDEISFVQGFGQKIRQARQKKNLTIEELALELKERESFLQKVEQEKALPDKQLAGKIEKFFGFKITE